VPYFGRNAKIVVSWDMSYFSALPGSRQVFQKSGLYGFCTLVPADQEFQKVKTKHHLYILTLHKTP